MASGYTYSQIAKMVRTGVATVRREIDRALAKRPLETPERFAQVQVARLIKALRFAEAAVELGELKAVAVYLRIVAAIERYHELAAGSPPSRRSTKAPPNALPAPPKALTFAAPPKALTFAAPPDDSDSSTVEEARGAMEKTQL